jgi:hypothetical protein
MQSPGNIGRGDNHDKFLGIRVLLPGELWFKETLLFPPLVPRALNTFRVVTGIKLAL